MTGRINLRRIAAGAIAGLGGGGIIVLLPSGLDVPAGIVVVVLCLLGALFAALTENRALAEGSALVWALGWNFLLWVFACALTGVLHGANSRMPMEDIVRMRFPLLAALVVAAVPLGLVVGAVSKNTRDDGPHLRIARALVAGGFAGIFGGWAFGKWMEQAGFFPLIAGLVHSRSVPVGVALHFAIAIVIGATFGLLFQHEIRGLGSSLCWGAWYGLVWWFVGALTLLPLLQGALPNWSLSFAASLFGSLVGHIVYGLIVGFLYAVVDGGWIWFFERSDPLARQWEGSGSVAFGSVLRGAAASLGGGLLFSIVMFETGALTRVAQLVGASSIAVGFIVHLVISAIIGVTYGLLFHFEAVDELAAIAWGAVYGLIWWFVGPLTLFPILLGGTFTWTARAASAQMPSLLGHLVYGIALAIVFRALERGHLVHLFIDERVKRRWMRKQRPDDGPAPALWLFLLGAGGVLPIILGS